MEIADRRTLPDADDELLDVVDDDDRVMGQQLRSIAYAAGRRDFRVVNASWRTALAVCSSRAARRPSGCSHPALT
jgi:hypothetical protein